jgi:hypothetical protein
VGARIAINLMGSEGGLIRAAASTQSLGASFVSVATDMLERAMTCLILALVVMNGAWPAAAVTTVPQEVTETEEQEARNLATQFVEQLTESKDFAPVVEHLYVHDFIQRFNQSKLTHSEMPLDLYFMPGLDYDAALLSRGTTDDWKNFYVAENTFLLLGLVYASKRISAKGEDIRPTDLYPKASD